MPSKIVLPLSKSPCLYSSCANLEIVLRSVMRMNDLDGMRLCDKRGQAHVFVYPGSEGSWVVALSLPPNLPSQDKIFQTTSTLWSSGRIFCTFSCTVLPLSVEIFKFCNVNVQTDGRTSNFSESSKIDARRR